VIEVGGAESHRSGRTQGGSLVAIPASQHLGGLHVNHADRLLVSRGMLPPV